MFSSGPKQRFGNAYILEACTEIQRGILKLAEIHVISVHHHTESGYIFNPDLACTENSVRFRTETNYSDFSAAVLIMH